MVNLNTAPQVQTFEAFRRYTTADLAVDEATLKRVHLDRPQDNINKIVRVVAMDYRCRYATYATMRSASEGCASS
jgi:hypothetical protein